MHKKLNYLILSLILLFAILPFVSADKIIQGQELQGLQINSWEAHVVKQNTAYTFLWDVSQNGMLMKSTLTNCTFFLNENGVISKYFKGDGTRTSDENGWYVVIAGGNFSNIGHYNYQIDCFLLSNTTVSGNLLASFDVNPSGAVLEVKNAIVYAILLIMLIIFLIGCVTLFMENDHLLAKVGFLGLGYLLLMAITFISWQMAQDFLINSTFIADIFWILFLVLMVGLFPLLIGAFAWYVIMLFKIKEIERLMGKGFSEDEAIRRTSR